MTVSISGPPPGTGAAALGPGGRRGRTRSPDLRRLRSRTTRLLAELGHARSLLSLSLVDDAAIRLLNREWRGIDRATDVLSFSLLEGEHRGRRGELLGDVVVSVETAARQARRQHRSLDDVVARLVVHGVLHVLGHDHARPGEARVMRAEERRLWRKVRS